MRIMEEFGVGEQEAEAVVKAVAGRAFSLLLGAGASYGSEGGDKEILRGGEALAKEINERFSLGLVDSDARNLPLVYDDACSLNRGGLNSFLLNRFTRCKPTWQGRLFDFEWKRIWTLNIDDVLELAASRKGVRIYKYVWDEEFAPRRLDASELQIVFLHGYAGYLNNKPDHLIFSLKEYAGRAEYSPGWHAQFRSEFCQKPFIICGARLQDEYDLATVLDFGNRSRDRGGAPSIIVLREFSPGQAERFTRRGLIAIEAEGQKFFEALYDDVKAWKDSNLQIDKSIQNSIVEVLSSFRLLKVDSVESSGRRRLDYYASVEAQWSHIVEGMDALTKSASDIIAWAGRDDIKSVNFLLISGGPVSGKTTAAYRAAYELSMRGIDVLLFRGEQYFDESKLIEYLKYKPNTILLFDDCADHSGGFRTICEMLEGQSLYKVRVVATCESNRRRAVLADMLKGEVKELSLDPLSKTDFRAIYKKRSEKGRLGRCSGFPVNDAYKEFRSSYGSKLLEWLESLENSLQYREAIESAFKGSSNGNYMVRNILCLVSAVHRFGYSLPFFIVDPYLKNGFLEGLLSEDGPLSLVAHTDGNGLRLRSKVFSEYVWNRLSEDERYRWLLALANELAPLVVPATISKRTLPYLILKNIMHWESLKRDLGAKRADGWYSQIEKTFSWNARFWEQRALLASDMDLESKAYSYAKQAISLHGSDAFPHTTLGKICLKIGVTRKDSVGVERFWEGVESLLRSREIALSSGIEWEHPYVTFFTYALRAKSLVSFDGEDYRLNQTWSEWMRAAEKSSVFKFEPDELKRYQRSWLLSSLRG
ncbi:hypothetical protein FA467_01815 [Pseudomonas aeruginosa]|nr:hypothetical protein [Pseudomonas aeruginosa]